MLILIKIASQVKMMMIKLVVKTESFFVINHKIA